MSGFEVARTPEPTPAWNAAIEARRYHGMVARNVARATSGHTSQEHTHVLHEQRVCL